MEIELLAPSLDLFLLVLAESRSKAVSSLAEHFPQVAFFFSHSFSPLQEPTTSTVPAVHFYCYVRTCSYAILVLKRFSPAWNLQPRMELSTKETVLEETFRSLTVHDPPTERAGNPLEVPPYRSHDPANNLKRTDPFQFGSRLLNEEDDVFEFNAWDHVQVSDTYKEYAELQYAKQREAPVSDFDKSKSSFLHCSPMVLHPHPDD
jgi:hypothetical protein